jgi:hypothetical protein
MPRRSNFCHTLWTTVAAVLVIACARNQCSASQENAAPPEPVVAIRPATSAAASEYRLAYKFRPNQDVRMLKVFASQMRIQKGGRTDVNAIQ